MVSILGSSHIFYNMIQWGIVQDAAIDKWLLCRCHINIWLGIWLQKNESGKNQNTQDEASRWKPMCDITGTSKNPKLGSERNFIKDNFYCSLQSKSWMESKQNLTLIQRNIWKFMETVQGCPKKHNRDLKVSWRTEYFDWGIHALFKVSVGVPTIKKKILISVLI